MNPAPNILIVGQGLAGSLMSFNLYQRGITHKVMDAGHIGAASKAAAGIINPITGRRYVKSWMLDALLPEARKTYGALEKLLDAKLLIETVVIRSMPDVSRENDWEVSTARPGYDAYTGDRTDPGDFTGFVETQYSYRWIKGALRADLPALIRQYRIFLKKENMLFEEEFSFDNADWHRPPVRIHNEAFTHVIFCEGYRGIYNPFFNYLPFQPAKGEALIIEIPSLETDQILREEIFLAPWKKHLIWSGGGYEWSFSDDKPTPGFREKWEQKLSRLLTVNYRINDHIAGVRPSVKGRRPLVGKHPQFEHLFILNGLGTKGSSLGPYFAQQLAGFIEGRQSLTPEADILRFDNK